MQMYSNKSVNKYIFLIIKMHSQNVYDILRKNVNEKGIFDNFTQKKSFSLR